MEVRKIGEIKEELKATADTELSEFIRRYAADERAGVRTMLAQAQKRQEKYEKEILRIEALKVYERKYAMYKKVIEALDAVWDDMQALMSMQG